jgi:peptidoglycan/LPS O-acetylase OafA/YrhL
VEEQFYLLWPCLFLIFRKRIPNLIRLLLVLIPVLWTYRIFLELHGVADEYLYTAFETRVDAILVGCVLALLVHGSTGKDFVYEMRRARYLPIPLIGLAISIYFGISHFYRYTAGFIIDPVLVALLIGQLTQLRGLKWMDAKPISYLGRISYSTYLYQQIVHPLIARFVPDPYASFVILPAVWIVAAISYEAIEKPFLRLKSRFKGKSAMDVDGVAVAVGGLSTGS